MRRILVEKARRKKRHKHGGEFQRVDLEEASLTVGPPREDLIALDEALSRLAAIDPTRAELVKLRFFAGLTVPQAAGALGVSVATAERHCGWQTSCLGATPTACWSPAVPVHSPFR